MNLKPILLVEDNADDVDLTIRAFARNQIRNPVVVANDGVEALDFLWGRGEHVGRDTSDQPQVVLLDINMPRLGGLETLEQIREDPRTRLLPVVMLTTSTEEKDLLRAYEGHANSYIRKPVNFTEFIEAMRQLGLYWLLINQPAPIPTPATQEESDYG